MHKRHFMTLIAAASVVALAGCSTTGSGPRLAGGRAATIGAPSADVKAAIANARISNGYAITRDSDFVLEFSRVTTDFWATFLLSSGYDSTVHQRLTYQIVGSDPTNVTWRAYLVTNPGSGFERLTEVTNNPNNDPLQQELMALKAQLEGS